MDEFIAQFDDEDLACFVRGEGMGSSLVTAGTASAFAGVSPNLIAHKIPSVCCDDGPSGMDSTQVLRHSHFQMALCADLHSTGN